MLIRDRIKELRRVPAKDLRPNPENWRTHPKAQADALRGVLAEIGVVDAVLAFPADGRGPDGDFSDLMLFDGHLRVETLPGQDVPVLVTDLTREEARKAMLTIDPLAAMAEADAGKLDDLLREVETGSEDLAKMLESLAKNSGLLDTLVEAKTGKEMAAADIYAIVVEFADESQQRAFYERMKGEGNKCRVLML